MKGSSVVKLLWILNLIFITFFAVITIGADDLNIYKFLNYRMIELLGWLSLM